MSNTLNEMVSVSIDIASPLTDSSSFDHLLIIGPEPLASDHSAPKIGVYTSLTAVSEAGFVTTGDKADVVGRAARIAFSQSPTPSKIYIATVGITITTPENYEELEEETYSEVSGYSYGELEGDFSYTFDESPVEVLDLAVATSGWYVICPVGLDEWILDIITWTETQEKMCCFTELDDEPVLPNLYFRSFGIYGKTAFEAALTTEEKDNLCLNVAWAARFLSFHAGEETWVYKQLTSVYPATLTDTQKQILSEKNISYFQASAGKNIPFGGKTLNGEWIDVVRFRDWLKNDMQIRVANLFLTNPKIAYTDSGIALVQNQMIASLKSGVQWGGITEVEYDENGTAIPSFTTSVPLSSNLTATQRTSRTLEGCTFTARISGAIHFAEIQGNLTYEA